MIGLGGIQEAMKVGIYYEPEAYTTQGEKLMGRNAAGEGFLSAYARFHKCREHWVWTDTREKAEHFGTVLSSHDRREPVRWLPRGRTPTPVDLPMSLYLPGPGLDRYAWFRHVNSLEGLALTGITHTTASDVAMDLLVKLVTAPLKPFDALICTSNAVLKHVENVFEHQEAYLRMIHGANRFVRPILPIIPLGVHSESFSSLRLPQSAIEARQFFGISDEAIVILYVGRLSFHAKAHPLPMYDAASRAQALTRKEVVIIECGWYANIHIKEAFDSAADLIAPNLKRIYVDGRRPVDRDRAWAAADIFCSLADNVQETFGITPIEAMAAGLPVVVSDWDGYRETVEHGVQGFRIKTTIPYPGLGKDLADLFAVEALNYDRYCGYTSSFVSVDIEQLIKTFELLFNDRELREQLGRNGQLRVAEKYDWSGIISQYEQLWIEQHRIMSGMRRTSLTHTINPARLDPFDAFKHYATRAIDPKDWVAPRNGLNSSFIDEYRKREQLAIVKFSQPVTLSSKEIISLLQTMPPSGTSLEKLAQSAPIESKPMVFRTIVWLAKIGILEISQKTEE